MFVCVFLFTTMLLFIRYSENDEFRCWNMKMPWTKYQRCCFFFVYVNWDKGKRCMPCAKTNQRDITIHINFSDKHIFWLWNCTEQTHCHQSDLRIFERKDRIKQKKNVNKPKKEKDCRRIKHKIEVETNGREKKVHAHLAQHFGCAEWCVCGGLVSVYVSARVFIAFHVSIIMVSFVGFSARSAQLAS